jgi:signal transduction histidine kinase
VGGSVKDYPREGQEAGRIAVQILKGELTLSRAPPPIRIPSLSLFDWRQMKRWGLDETRLPKGSVIEYRPVTLWSQHPWYVFGTATFAVLESLLILALSQQVRRRREAVALLTHELEDRKRAEEERNALQLQLGHAQKMESVGRLAGGVAHDFNNLLGGILAQAESMEQDLPEGSPQLDELHRIQEATIRGSEIVRELMIYSGQEKADLELVDLAQLTEEMMQLLKVSVSKHALEDRTPRTARRSRQRPQLRQLV